MASRFGQRGTPAAGNGQPRKGRFAGVDLTLGTGKPLLPDGNHDLKVLETRYSDKRGETFFAEVEILDTDRQDVKPGSKYVWMRTLKDSYGYGVAEVTRFAIACGNLDDDGIAELLKELDEGTSVVDAACGVAGTEYGEQPLADCKVRVYVSREGCQPSKDGRIYPNCTFEPYPEDTAPAATTA